MTVTVRAAEDVDADTVTCAEAVRVMVPTWLVEDVACFTEVELVVVDAVVRLETEMLLEDAAEGDRRVLFGAFVEMDVETAVYGIELEVADVTFELMRSTVLFPVI